MSADRTYRIRVVADGDPSGVQKVTEALDKTNEKVEKGTGLNEKHAAGLHALHRLFHQLNEVVPGLGVVMQAAFSPIGATISIAVMALQIFREHMQKVNEEFKKLEEEAARPATNRMSALREATVAAAEGMDGLYRSLDQAARGEQTLAQVTEQTSAAFREEIRAATTLADAMKENDLAALEERHAAGLSSEEEYATQRLEIELRYQQKKRELQEREEMTEILSRRRLLEQAEIKQPGLTAAAEAAVSSKTKALEDLGSLDKSGVDERKKEAATKLKEFEEGLTGGWWGKLVGAERDKQLEGFQALGPGKTRGDADRWFRDHASQYGYHTNGAETYEQWDVLKRGAMGAEAEWKQFPGVEAARKVAADRASDEAARAAKAAIDNQSFITTTGQDIGDRRSRFDAHHQASEEIGGIEQDTAHRRQGTAALNSPIGKLLQDAANAESTLQAGGQISLGQQVQIKAAIEMLTRAHVAQGDVVIQGLGSLHGTIESITRQIANLAQKVEQHRIQSISSGWGS